MNLEKVLYRDGRPYLPYINHRNNELVRVFGQIVNCAECKKPCFIRNDGLKIGGKFCSRSCKSKLENSPKWRGGIQRKNGYLLVKLPNHPAADNQGYVYEHRLIMEKKIGRYLHKLEVVHHINEIRSDNRLENLMLFESNAEHHKHHTRMRRSENA